MKHIRRQVSPSYLFCLFTYCPTTGILTWNNSEKVRRDLRGKEAGSTHCSGYRTVSINNSQYKVSRVAFAMMTGEWPAQQLDHVNRVRNDNRWINLREATVSENMRNRTAWGFKTSRRKGVRFAHGRYEARIQVNKVSHFLGSFDLEDQAAAAYIEAAKQLHGGFSVYESGLAA
jgi:hypothetical protein